MAARRVGPRLLWAAALLLAPLALYRVTEGLVARQLGYDAGGPPPPQTPQVQAQPRDPGPESPAPTAAPAARPLRAVALLVRGFGPRGVDARAALDAEVPLTLGVTPFTPFALRISREAAKKHKEVLVDLPPAELLPPADFARVAVQAVWYPTGLLLRAPAPELPTAALAARGAFLVGAPDTRADGLPHLSVDGVLDASGPSGALQNDPAVLLVEAAALGDALRWLDASGARPLFVSEALIARAGAKAVLPSRATGSAAPSGG